MALSQALIVYDNPSSTKLAVGHRLHTAVKLMVRLALKCGALVGLLYIMAQSFQGGGSLLLVREMLG
ncbi:hypothetical protein [Anaerobiospirillum succiniciproducens]|uniref:hypothetical protein n=1 Tax=Anaerobiospirillum succiniciproducens TaxID=13335 RepID=UPI0029434A42|nr:hypothetical protein [Anaerobiospirillum succiniciproducens]